LAIRALIMLPWLLAIGGIISASSFLAGAPSEANESIGWAAGLAALPVLAMLAVTMLQYFGKLRGLTLALIVLAVTVIELFQYGMSLNDGTEDPRAAYREQPQLVDMLKQDQA